MYSRNPRTLIADLAQHAGEVGVLSDNLRYTLRNHKPGEPLPDFCKPGYMITRLPPEVRETLSRLRSDDVKHMLEFYPDQLAKYSNQSKGKP